MTRTYHDIWLELYQLGAPDTSIARICGTYSTRIQKWRTIKKLPIIAKRTGHRELWEDSHQAEIKEILEKQ